jgi:hypothetical protein
MDISGVAGITSKITEMATGQTNEAVGMAVLKKAMDIDASSAAALIDAIPAAPAAAHNLPPHLGQNINTTA